MNTEDMDALVLSATVARRYWIDDMSKSEIASELGMSRFRVARILEKAREGGFVRIEFDFPAGEVDIELSSALKSAYGLKHSIVTTGDGENPELIASVGSAAGALLREIGKPDDVLGFAWARVIEAMPAHMTPLSAAAAVQLCGALPGTSGSTAIDVVRDVTRAVEADPYVFYAPMYASDAEAAEAIRRQPDVVAAAEMYPAVTRAVVGVGAWQQGMSLAFDWAGEEDRATVGAHGGTVEMCGIILDAEGQAVTTPLQERRIGIAPETLAKIPEVIGVVFGTEKVPAVRASVLGGYVNSLVTHSAFARAMLDY